MKITIAHLYFDLLNLYGESGNVKALKLTLENLGFEVELKKLSLNDKFKFDNYDFIYIGCGTNNNQDLALQHLTKYKKDIIKAIKSKKYFLVTGNALEMFGKYIIDEDKQIECLDIFDYYSYRDKRRYVDEVIEENQLFENKLIGFRNQGSFTNQVNSPLFNSVKGIGNNHDTTEEGFVNQNFFASYLLGPVLVRNPEFLSYLINRLLSDLNYESERILDLNLDKIAYNHFIKWKYEKK